MEGFGIGSNNVVPLTVTQVVGTIKSVLEEVFPELYFEGEISELKGGKTGHLYLTIKDERSQLSAVIWAGVARSISFKIEPGLKVSCWGRPTLYPQRGSLQIVLNRISLAGEGALQKKFAELKQKLELEGFFEVSRKRRLPFLPKGIGIVTSAQGAVIHDIQVKLNERFPSIRKVLVDVAVQGDGASKDIAAGIKLLSDSGTVDVIIVARGGGSLQDLWSFNEEVVVKAIFASKVPVVSGVGHETDVTLADLAADLRAPTPTAAAESVVPRREELLGRIAEFERRISDFSRWLFPIMQRLDDLSLRLDSGSKRLLGDLVELTSRAQALLKRVEPEAIIRRLNIEIDLFRSQCETALSRLLSVRREKVRALSECVSDLSPAAKVGLMKEKVDGFDRRARVGVLNRCKSLESKVSELAARAESVSPTAVLKRGFAYVKSGNRFISRGTELKHGDPLSLTFYDQTIDVKVEGK